MCTDAYTTWIDKMNNGKLNYQLIQKLLYFRERKWDEVLVITNAYKIYHASYKWKKYSNRCEDSCTFLYRFLEHVMLICKKIQQNQIWLETFLFTHYYFMQAAELHSKNNCKCRPTSRIKATLTPLNFCNLNILYSLLWAPETEVKTLVVINSVTFSHNWIRFLV
jgi:hypothetical protein